MTSSSFLLDTHVWLWLSTAREKIKPEAQALLHQAGSQSLLSISAISLFEVAALVSRSRVELSMPLADWFALSFAEPALPIVAITPEIALASLQLPAQFHRDPNDRLIAATAIAHGLTLCTHDGDMIRFGALGLYNVLEI